MFEVTLSDLLDLSPCDGWDKKRLSFSPHLLYINKA